MPSPRFIQMPSLEQGVNTCQLHEGLLGGEKKEQAQIAPKYFYDELGSRLFEAITALPEYYPTRAEMAILAQQQAAIASYMGTQATLIDLGAGNCEKASSLFAALQPAQYVAVDISAQFLRNILQRLQREHAAIAMLGVGMDFSETLILPAEVQTHHRWFFYPGSSIGNFHPIEALAFLKRIHQACDADKNHNSGLLIGVDLVKDTARLEAAYDDELGVTAAFNLNLLKHVNKIIQANFKVRDWQHRAWFNVSESRIEMHLQARQETQLEWMFNGTQFTRIFAAGETIHTENSYKYRPQQFADMLQQAGFVNATMLSDASQDFAVFCARAH